MDEGIPFSHPDQPKSTEIKSAEFQGDLAHILDTPLTPENIDSYADHALTQLIGLTGKVTQEYDKELAADPTLGKELEDEAFTHFGLGNIEEILSHVVATQRKINSLDGLIDGAENAQQILVPPDRDNPETTIRDQFGCLTLFC